MMQFKLDIATVILFIINITIIESQSDEKQNPKKIVNNEPSRSQINAKPSQLDQNCMCDEDCKTYKDCCKDCDYYNETEQLGKSEFQCHPKYKVYMKASCPPSYQSSPLTRIREKCENSSFHMNPVMGYINITDHKNFFNPVSVVNKSITFANLYCARCHGEQTYVKWNYSNTCWAVNDVPSHISANSDGSYYPLDTNSNSKCFYNLTLPMTVLEHVRPCVTAVSMCEIDKKLQHVCDSYTAYVKDDGGRIYKNADCAQCNNATKTEAFKLSYIGALSIKIGDMFKNVSTTTPAYKLTKSPVTRYTRKN